VQALFLVNRQRGQAALEALLSIILLFIFFFVMWAVAVAIHNQSRMQTAAQLAAQGALLTYDRTAYKGQDQVRAQAAMARSQIIARSLYAENACGMIPAPFTDETPPACTPDIPDLRVEIACSPVLHDAGAFSPENCGRSGGGAEGGNLDAAVRVFVEAEARQPLILVSPDPDETLALAPLLRGQALAYSFEPRQSMQIGEEEE